MVLLGIKRQICYFLKSWFKDIEINIKVFAAVRTPTEVNIFKATEGSP
jgi:hypothetical protein